MIMAPHDPLITQFAEPITVIQNGEIVDDGARDYVLVMPEQTVYLNQGEVA